MNKNNNFKNNEEEKYYKKLIAEHETEEAKELENINKNYNQRPLISEPFDLKPYLPEFTNYQYHVYLSYIYQLNSYMLITDNDEDIFFKPLKIKCYPDNFYTDCDKQDHYEDLEQEIRKILKHYEENLKQTCQFPHEVEEKVDDLILTIIDKLSLNLSDLYDMNHYTKIGKYPNKSMKQYILNPVKIYNDYLEMSESDKMTTEEFEEKRKKETENVVKKIKTNLSHVKTLYCENQNNIIPRQEKEINKAINDLISSTKAEPYLNLYLGHSPVKYYQARAGENITKDLGLKRNVQGTNEKLYLYNDEAGYYEEITVPQLKNKLYSILGFNLIESDITNSIKAIPNEDKLYKNLLVFKNLLFDIETLEEFKPFKENATYNRKDYLTINNIGSLNQNNNTIKLLDFQEDLKLSDVLLPKQLPEINTQMPVNKYTQNYGMTLTEIVLRQILIPKDNPNDIRLLKDFLERLGSNIYGTNLYKVITFYYGDGDNGKSVLNLFNDLIFNNLNYEITADTLNDKFKLPSFKNRLIVSIDEVTRDSFKGLKAFLKHVSSKYAKMEEREMYTQKTNKQYGFPNLTIYSNELLELSPQQDKALFGRLDYLKLPNKFVAQKELNKYENTYPLVNEVENLLKKDHDGLSWLITASIKAFTEMRKQDNIYTCNQTIDETIDIYWNIDYISKFLYLYTEYVNDLPRNEFVSNQEISNSYLEYMQEQNKTVDTENLSREIGKKLNQIYPDLKKEGNRYKETGTGRAMYKVRLKEYEDIIKEFNQVYEINEDVTDKQLNILSHDGNLKIVYKHIQKGNSSINLLQKKLPNTNCLEIVKQLESLNLIINTKNLVLNP